MKFVTVIPRSLPGGTIYCDAVPHLILNDQHPQLLELLAQLLDVVGHDPVVDVHIGPVVEHVETAGDVDFQRGGDEVGLLLVLRSESVVEVLQDGHILRAGVVEIVLVHQPDTAVNDRLLHGLKAVLAAHYDIAEGEQKIHFQRQRGFIVRIVQVEIHGVDVLFAGGGDFDDLTAQPLDQGVILGLRVRDEDIVIGDEEDVEHFPLGGEGFAAPRSAED